METEKATHEGDLWKNSKTGDEYIYRSGNWEEMPVPDSVFDEIDGKSQIFSTQPKPPYSVDDLYFTGNDILVCLKDRETGEYVASDWQKKDNYTDDSTVTDFIENIYDPKIEDIQNQIDGKIDTYYYDYEPANSNHPASEWTTAYERQKHVGDLFFWKNKGFTYRYMKVDTSYQWVRVKDADIVYNYVEFNVSERGKTRHIKSPSIRDKILQRAVCDNILESILYPKLIYNNGASIKDKGVEFTRQQLVKHLRRYYVEHGNDGYILTCDFRKFFESIPHDKLISALQKYIPNEDTINLLKIIIYSYNDDGVGLGIGSQASQIFGVFYPTPIDTYCTVVEGNKYYARHMDDFYVIHHDKEYLKQLLPKIRKIADELGLTLNEKKTQICKLSKGFVFLKQFIYMTDTGKIVRRPVKKNVVRERRKLKTFHKKLQNGEMTMKYIREHYKSWRGTTKKYAKPYTIKNMDALYVSLFGTGE